MPACSRPAMSTAGGRVVTPGAIPPIVNIFVVSWDGDDDAWRKV